MNWNHIKTFITVARAGSVASAAKMLGINHSTIIRRLEKLDEDLAARLFDHTQSGYKLTEIGEAVFARAERMEEIALAILRDIKGKDDIPAGTLRIAQPENGFIDLSHMLHEFRRQYPLIELSVSSSPEPSNLDRFEADLAIRLTNSPPLHWIGKILSRVEFAAYASAEYIRAQGGITQPGEGEWLLWVGMAGSATPAVDHPEELLRQSMPEMKIGLRSNSMGDVSAGVRNGLGIGLLSTANARNIEGLVELPFTDRIPEALRSCSLWLLVHPDLRDSARVRAFMNFVSEHFARAGNRAG